MSKAEVLERVMRFLARYGFCNKDEIALLLHREKHGVFYDSDSRPGYVLLRPAAQIAAYLQKVRQDTSDIERSAVAEEMLRVGRSIFDPQDPF